MTAPRTIQLTADQVEQLAMGERIRAEQQSIDGSQLSTDQLSALCDGGRVDVVSDDEQGVRLVGVSLT